MRLFNHLMSLFGFAGLLSSVAAALIFAVAGPALPQLVSLHHWMAFLSPLLPH